ncbi:MAG: Electron transfer flavoprotein-ubiquinone oxidoreductase [Pelotomaculum sp. PtaB.Bin104]|nr:MAG: Electron transfer flavoprotein-ubiquinone oxidoreductase [Pelotomaculum sp. PtaB.Bin104]
MNNEDKFDAIIVGAGPAGSACAYTLAKEGKSVLIIERGDTPGSKNVTGGRLYTYALEMLDKGLYEGAALERKVTHEQIMMLSGDRAINIDFHNPSYNETQKAPMSYTVLRAAFDEWLASKAEERGAMLVCGIKVDELIEQNNKIVGVIAGEDEMYADIVIAADGVNSFMAQKAGLSGDIAAEAVGVGVKEVIKLPARIIEQRFNLKEDEGAARMLLGCTEGIHGGGFLYTNQDSISLGAVFMPEEVGHKKQSVHEIFQELKMHPSIYQLIEGGETIEYSAHLVPETGFRGISKKLYREGFLIVGDAAGFVINTGYSIRGIDLAIVSGIAAARAVISASNGAETGPLYLKELHDMRLLPTMKAVDGFSDILETPWIYDKVPNLINDVFDSLFTVDGEVPISIKKSVMKLIKENGLSLWQLIKFGIKGVRSL